MAVLGVARVADPKGKVHYLTKPADARVTMILEGALLSLAHSSVELTVKAGDSFEIPLQVSRSSKLPESIRLELVGPKPVLDALEADPVTVDVGKARSVLLVRTKSNPRLVGEWTLTVRATAMQADRWRVVSETEVPVRFVGAK